MSNSVRPHRWQPTRLPHPWDSPGKNERNSGWRQKIRHSVLWEKPRKTSLQIVRCKDFHESKFLHLLMPRETLMSWTNVWTWFSWLAPQQLSYFCSSLGHISLTFLLSLFLQVVVCCPKGPGVRDKNENRTRNLMQRIRDLQTLLDWGGVHSASSFHSWLQTTKLSLIYLSQDTTLTQSRSCFYPKPFPSGKVSGTISKCVESVHG